jgi:hypothetical protein
MRKVHEIEKEPSRDGKEEKVREALFGDDGLEDREERRGELKGEDAERVRKAVEEEEEREKTRDQQGV